MSQEQELQASRWIQNQSGLEVSIGDNGKVTLIYGFSIEATGIGFVDAVRKFQYIAKNKSTGEQSCLNN